MLKKIKSKYQTHKTLSSNIIALFILKGSDYILPLLILPFLVRTLGLENFGLLAFATATVSFFRAIVSYGFDISGTQLISISIGNEKKTSEIISSILIAKFLLTIITFVILLGMIIFIAKFNTNWYLYLFTFLIIIGDVLFPVWYFQGIEKMKVITYLKLIYKMIFALSIFIFVNENQDYILVPIFDAIGAIIIGIISLYIIYYRLNILFIFPSFELIKKQFIDGWYIFISQIAVVFYTSLNTFVLGLLTTNESVGIYSLAYKIYFALRGILTPISSSLFPYLSKEYQKNKIFYYKKVKIISFFYSICLIIIAFVAYIFSEDIVYLIVGKVDSFIVDILKILLYALPFSIGSLYSILLVIKSEGKRLSKITFTIMLVNLVLVFPSIYLYGIYGLAWQVVIIQFVQAILQIKYNIEIFNKYFR